MESRDVVAEWFPNGRQAAMLARVWMAGDAANLILQELKNKLEVFTLVKNLADKLELPANGFVPLQELVDSLFPVSFDALWASGGGRPLLC